MSWATPTKFWGNNLGCLVEKCKFVQFKIKRLCMICNTTNERIYWSCFRENRIYSDYYTNIVNECEFVLHFAVHKAVLRSLFLIKSLFISQILKKKDLRCWKHWRETAQLKHVFKACNKSIQWFSSFLLIYRFY